MDTQTNSAADSVLVKGLVVIGLVVSIGLIAVSATLNYRMGLRSGEGGFDGMVYGVGAACGDLLKSMSPFMGNWGLRTKDRLAVGVAAVLYVTLTAYSFTAAYGFSTIHRADLIDTGNKRSEDHAGIKAALKRTEARLEQLGVQRSVAEVDAAIAAAYAAPLGKSSLEAASAHCTVLRTWTLKPCQNVHEMESERAAAEEQERLSASAEKLRVELKNEKPVPGESDAQLEGLKGLLAVAHVELSKNTIGYGLALLLACLIELGSGLGLYLVTTPLRATAPKPMMTASTPAASTPEADPTRGEVADYVTANVVLADGGEAAMVDLFTDYVGWCRRLNRYAVARASFEKAFHRFAQLAGVSGEILAGDVVYSGIAILAE